MRPGIAFVVPGLLVAALLPCLATAADTGSDAWASAIIGRDSAAIRRLADGGADVNRVAGGGQTALMAAAAQDDLPLMRLLLDSGARVDAHNSRGGTALMYSATAGDVDAVKLLLVRGADPDARASNGWTALTLAAARGFDHVAEALLARGADPNVADIYGWTPLMRAVQQDRPGAVRVLLRSARVDLAARNENGRTALHQAAAEGLTEIVRLLVERGADAGAPDSTGNTPAALAARAGHADVAALLGRTRRQE